MEVLTETERRKVYGCWLSKKEWMLVTRTAKEEKERQKESGQEVKEAESKESEIVKSEGKEGGRRRRGTFTFGDCS